MGKYSYLFLDNTDQENQLLEAIAQLLDELQ